MDRVYKALIEEIEEQEEEKKGIGFLKEHKKFFKNNVKPFRPIGM